MSKRDIGIDLGTTNSCVAVYEGGEPIVITDTSARTRQDAVLLRCAGSFGLSLDGFRFVGFPEGTTFAFENDELKVVGCPVDGLLLILR